MLAKYVITNGGSLHPLVIPASETNGTGLMNPSVYVDNGKVVMNLRHCQYTIYHSYNEKLLLRTRREDEYC
jgi:hypothetical protein